MSSEEEDYDSNEEYDPMDDYEEDNFFESVTEEINYDKPKDIEMGVYECLRIQDVAAVFNKDIEDLKEVINFTTPAAKFMLYLHKWSVSTITEEYFQDQEKLLKESQISSTSLMPQSYLSEGHPDLEEACECCFVEAPISAFRTLPCGHLFCKHCWQAHIAIQIGQGNVMGIECMGRNCNLVLMEDFVLANISQSLAEKFKRFVTSACVESHPLLRFCLGKGCESIFRVWEVDVRKLECTSCLFKLCFKCGNGYHLPLDCDTNKLWIKKCTDDSETANYIMANTKECPKCASVIEKATGCNRMLCTKCKHNFCWLCRSPWICDDKTYKCSRADTCTVWGKEERNADSDAERAKSSLDKFLFYNDRWTNHERNTILERKALAKAKENILKMVKGYECLSSDWNYLEEAYQLLEKVRYTMKYTYPFVFYAQSLPRKELVEYQQNSMEEAIEKLTSTLERVDLADKASVVCQMMQSLENQRITLLQQFLKPTY